MLHFRPLLTLALACLLGCAPSSPDKLMESARSYLANGDRPAAIIQLKNALQIEPEHAEARFLFGKTLLEQDQAGAAAIELQKALDLGFQSNQVVPLLGKALLLSSQSKKVIELDRNSELSDPVAIADFKTTVAQAHAFEGAGAQAEKAISAALQAKPGHGSALVYQARVLSGKREFDGAMKLADQVLSATPDHVEALVLKGDLLRFGRNDAAGAREHYRKALAVKPDDVVATAALLDVSLSQNDLEGARAQLAQLQKSRPGHSQTRYFEARLAILEGKLDKAEELAQLLLKAGSDDPAFLQLAGMVAMQRNELSLAQDRFTAMVRKAPRSSIARQHLARVHLRRGEPAKAMEALEPLLTSPSPDALTLSIAGGASLTAGDFKKAQEFYARAGQANRADAHSRMGLAVARTLGGNPSGLGDLGAIASQDSGTEADMTLISAYIGRRDYPNALKAIDRLESKSPGKPQAAHLRGLTLALQGQLAPARASYEKALATDPKFFPSIDGLAALDWREGKRDAARARLEQFSKTDPRDVRAILALASLNEKSAAPMQDVAALLAKAISLKPSDAQLRSRLVQYYLGKSEPKLALAAARDAAVALPNDPVVLGVLAHAQLDAGETNQAVASYSKLASLQPKSPMPWLGVADAYIAAKKYAEASDAVKKAAALAPTEPAVIGKSAQIEMLAGRPDAALNKVRAVQSSTPKAALGFAMEGDIELSRRNWPAAIAAYRAALQRDPNATTLAQRLYVVLRASGDLEKADTFGRQWIEKHPADTLFAFSVARFLIADRRYEMAEAQLRQILRLAPDNAAANNNLAWVLWAQKRPGALEAAERANRMAPNRPTYMDTLATVLADQGQLERALTLQRQAVELAPGDHAHRLALARLYIKAGSKAEARRELGVLEKLGESFAQQKEVKVMLADL
jgi:putative PEP-CTERM system TPR-repeat lipoprotein